MSGGRRVWLWLLKNTLNPVIRAAGPGRPGAVDRYGMSAGRVGRPDESRCCCWPWLGDHLAPRSRPHRSRYVASVSQQRRGLLPRHFSVLLRDLRDRPHQPCPSEVGNPGLGEPGLRRSSLRRATEAPAPAALGLTDDTLGDGSPPDRQWFCCGRPGTPRVACAHSGPPDAWVGRWRAARRPAWGVAPSAADSGRRANATPRWGRPFFATRVTRVGSWMRTVAQSLAASRPDEALGMRRKRGGGRLRGFWSPPPGMRWAASRRRSVADGVATGWRRRPRWRRGLYDRDGTRATACCSASTTRSTGGGDWTLHRVTVAVARIPAGRPRAGAAPARGAGIIEP